MSQPHPSHEELLHCVEELEGAHEAPHVLEKQLQDEVNWRKLLIQESRDGIVVSDEDCKVIETNKQFAHMLGYQLEEVQQLHAWDWDTQFTKEEILALARDDDGTGHHFQNRHKRKDGSLIEVELSNSGTSYNDKKLIFCIVRDITQSLKDKEKLEKTVSELQAAMAEVKTLQAILPICSFCKNIRDDKGYWEAVDTYLTKHSSTHFTHSICPTSMKTHYPEIFE